MQKNKLILLLKTLKEGEMSRLHTFLAADFYNKDEDVCQLFAFLRAHYPSFPASSVTKEQVFHHVYPAQAYDDKQFRYLMSRLNKLAECFLSLQHFETHPYQQQLDLLEALSRRGLEKSYRQADKTLAIALEARQEDSGSFFLAQFQRAEIKEQYFGGQHLRRFDENIQAASTQLDRYYYLHRLRISCAMLDRQTIFQAQYSLNLSAGWAHHLEEQGFFGEPVIRLYYIIYQALSDEAEESYFEKLKTSIAEEAGQVPMKDLREIYLFAINYCARKIRQSKALYVEDALKLYQSGIEEGILIEEGVLSPWAFTNVVKLLLRMKQYAQIETFIERYAPLLPEAFRDNALHYNLAELYYYTGRFGEAQEQLHQVAFSDLNYYLGGRVLLAKIYHETQAEEALLALLASFTIFLKRNKELSSDLKHTYLNFCKLLFQIVRSSPSRWNKICTQIQSAELLTDRTWLKEICKCAVMSGLWLYSCCQAYGG